MTGRIRRLRRWAERRRHRIRGYNPWRLGVDTVRAAGRHRVVGLAAEMAFFASLALIPFTVAFGAILGYSSQLIGADRVGELEAAAVEVMAVILSPQLLGDVVGPYVRSQFEREQGGVALLAIAGGLWLASRVLLPAVHALDLAYEVPDRRSLVVQRFVALLLAIASLIAITLIVAMLVVGPLLGTGRALAERFRFGGTFELVWSVGRWPVVVLVVAAFMLLVYRYGADVDMRWHTALPGAVVGVALWLLLAVGFRLYLASDIGIGQPMTAADDGGSGGGAAIVAVRRTVGAIVATALWTFLSSLALLVGGEVNAAVHRVRTRHDETDRAAVSVNHEDPTA